MNSRQKCTLWGMRPCHETLTSVVCAAVVVLTPSRRTTPDRAQPLAESPMACIVCIVVTRLFGYGFSEGQSGKERLLGNRCHFLSIPYHFQKRDWNLYLALVSFGS